MWQTTVSIGRPDVGTIVAQHIPVWVEQQSELQTVTHQRLYGTDVRLLFKIITLMGNPLTPIKANDVLIDEQRIDPDTGAGYIYRINSAVKTAFDGHQEMRGEVVPGT